MIDACIERMRASKNRNPSVDRFGASSGSIEFIERIALVGRSGNAIAPVARIVKISFFMIVD